MRVSLLSTMPPKPSYRRNRDYSKQFDWTYDLKKDVYNCYLKAKEDPKIGYMKRLKKYWDELHSEFNFLSDKNIRDQASCIEKNKAVMATEYETVTTIIVENVTLNEDNITNNEESSIDQSFLSLNLSQEALLEILPPMFQHNYETIKDQNIDKRVYSTKCNKKLSDYIIKGNGLFS